MLDLLYLHLVNLLKILSEVGHIPELLLLVVDNFIEEGINF